MRFRSSPSGTAPIATPSPPPPCPCASHLAALAQPPPSCGPPSPPTGPRQPTPCGPPSPAHPPRHRSPSASPLRPGRRAVGTAAAWAPPPSACLALPRHLHVAVRRAISMPTFAASQLHHATKNPRRRCRRPAPPSAPSPGRRSPPSAAAPIRAAAPFPCAGRRGRKRSSSPSNGCKTASNLENWQMQIAYYMRQSEIPMAFRVVMNFTFA
ncbi:hypothetical protein PVAP13_2NG536900 [Panicum virgatum]|uniref:Uncharacterized protein n=1 Tax=Panicum virgatum TaxID=38727 RepID=A0A8T0VVT0_PANVG|nr:hypothetical protein PVAP13_2NG536900 [Panicum virgatum]KAG2637767.1 hypothetical protein PVAP13_2NG536900 [Panicum virgatum]KAG2637768.1 hypothetical protein PVAP13_2NG536900 [Panicum virgatum]